MFYQSSKGPVDISTMPLRYASNALGKLTRDEPTRREEIEALEAHVAKLAEQDDQPVAGIGDNGGPALEEVARPNPQTWDALKLHLDDLLEQVRGITGIKIVDQSMADQAGQLLRDLQTAANLADTARTTEKAPLDQAIKEIQDRFNVYIAPIKNKTPGLVSKAEVALKNQIGEWLRKLDDDKREREKMAREAAEKAETEAREAHLAAALSDDLDEIDAAEELLAAADMAARDLKAVEREKPQIQNEGRAIGLRSVWKAVRIEGQGGKTLSHYAKTKPTRMIEFIQALANEDVKLGVRGDTIPGFNIIEERVV